MECGTLAQSQFPDIYREFESLQAQVRRAAHDYILSPQAGAVPLEVRNIEVGGGSEPTSCSGWKRSFTGLGSPFFQVARSLGILDEVNRMKVVPGTSPSSRPTNKSARYMEVRTADMDARPDWMFRVFLVCSIIGLLWSLIPAWRRFRSAALNISMLGSEMDQSC